MPSNADSSLVHAGDLLAGKYRVERVLGVGGMGIVVAATHIDLEQRVALKFLLPETVQNAEAVERFMREARNAVRLKSEHAAKVLDVGRLDGGAPYMVMEYLEGRDLAQLLESEGRLELPQAADFLLQACEAIAEAHSIGVVHRDLKPQNLFVTRSVHGAPLIKVLDFGISKAVTSGAIEDMALTRTGVVMGSPLYMSPEQMRSGRAIDARSDLWALGVILYQLLTNQLPFEAETVPHLCALVMTEPPRPIRELRRELPDAIDAVVRRCLEKDPARRYQSVAELARALERFAPASSKGASQRISNVGGARVPSAIITASAPAADLAHSRTQAAWGTSQIGVRTDATTRWLVIGAIAACVGVAGGWAIFRSTSGHGDAPTADAPTSRDTSAAATGTTGHAKDKPLDSPPPTSLAPPIDSAPKPAAQPASTPLASAQVHSSPPAKPTTFAPVSKPTSAPPKATASTLANKPPVTKPTTTTTATATTAPPPKDLFGDRK